MNKPLLTAVLALGAFSVNAEIQLNLSAATPAQMEQAIDAAAVSGDTAGIISFLVSLAKAESNQFSSMLAYAAEAAPGAMGDLILAIKAQVPELSMQVLAEVVDTLEAMGGKDAEIAAIKKTNPELVVSLEANGGDVEPAAGKKDTGNNNGNAPAGNAPTENPNQNSSN